MGDFFRNLSELIPPFEWRADLLAPWDSPASAVSSMWTVLLGTLVATACALIGCFLIVQGLALLGDAISHTVLLGLVVAFLLTGSVTGPAMFVGAAIAGVLTTALIAALHKTSRIKEDAAIGVVFTSLFAFGVVLLTKLASHVHLDTQHALMGLFEFSLLDKTLIAGHEVPVVVLQMTAVVVVLAVAIWLFYKELLSAAFDPGWSQTVGLRPRLFHYLLMAALSVTVVSSFTAVGAILVVAMLIAPAATAYLLSDRLPVMLVLSSLAGALSSLIGFHVSYWLDASTGGSMVCVACGLFGIAFLFSPRQGLIAVAWRRLRLRLRTEEENLVRALFKLAPESRPVAARDLATSMTLGEGRWRWLMWRLRREGWLESVTVEGVASAVRLTEFGLRQALRLDRTHRLWETFLVDRVGIASDHVHPTAEEIEHLLSEQLVENVDDLLGHPVVDPHGAPIPRSTQSDLRPGTYALSKLRVGDRGTIVGLDAAQPGRHVDSVARLELPLGKPFRVTHRDPVKTSWSMTVEDGQTWELSHAQADCVLVSLEGTGVSPRGP
jgi:ABC-type Mn2+/Zn2+ transport system permease subunit/Mn-dependent DtxR family transcriptional regulator